MSTEMEWNHVLNLSEKLKEYRKEDLFIPENKLSGELAEELKKIRQNQYESISNICKEINNRMK